jgi:hypothetical protein
VLLNLATALRYAHEVSRRVREVNGLLATPLCGDEAVRISRVWVFGSTIKGSLAPNDLDLLIDLREVGRRFTAEQTRVDRVRLRAHGLWLAPPARSEALKWITKNMRNVSRHCRDSEFAVIDKLVMIYPRNDLADQIKQGLHGGPDLR